MTPVSAAGPVVAILRALIEERTGLHYGLADHDTLLDRAGTRAIEAGFDSLLDYYYFLRYDPASASEFDKLVDALVVNETYFFREYDALRLAVTEFVQTAIAKGRRPRIWSAACSTGEEPLTLAMVLADLGLLSKVDLIATDISRRVLDRAQEGRFTKRAVRDFPDRKLVRQFLEELPTGGYAIAPELVRAVQWERVNLAIEAEVATMGTFDVVLCRNVLIYFSDDTSAQIVGSLTRRLTDDGALFVGVSESLLRFGTGLICEERDRIFFYRRAAK